MINLDKLQTRHISLTSIVKMNNCLIRFKFYTEKQMNEEFYSSKRELFILLFFKNKSKRDS